MNEPKYPDVYVPMSGQDGNAFFIISRVMTALKRAGVSKEERDEFMSEAMSGDYDHVLETVVAWVDID